MEEKIIDVLKSECVQIIISSKLPYICSGPTPLHGCFNTCYIGDTNTTIGRNIDPEKFLKIKSAIIDILMDSK